MAHTVKNLEVHDNGRVHVGNISYHGTEDRCLLELRSTDPRHDKARLEETKGGLLELYRWVFDEPAFKRWRAEDASRLLWIKGDPGKGKTMLICGIIDELRPATKLVEPSASTLLSFFYCQATDSRINSAVAVVRGLLYLLAVQHPPIVPHIRKKYDHAGGQLFKDANAWIAVTEILTTVLEDPELPMTYLVIDALDECEQDLPKLLAYIVKTSALPRVKWIVSSRNKRDIEMKLRLGPEERLDLEIRDTAEQVSLAVSKYIEHCVSGLPGIQDDPSLREKVEDVMLRKASGTFLWVSLVAKELQDVMPWDIMDTLQQMPTDLQDIYGRMMANIQRMKSKYQPLCLMVLATVVSTYRPLHLEELASIAGLPDSISASIKFVADIATSCGSFLTLRDDFVYIIHQSAEDFLEERFKASFMRERQSVHHDLFMRSLATMSGTLRRNIYEAMPSAQLVDIIRRRPSPDPLNPVRYACTYWVDHLGDSEQTTEDSQLVYNFLRQHFLHWLEALGILESISVGILSMRKLEVVLKGATSQVTTLIRDQDRLIRYFKSAIEASPLQAYASALVFSPSSSITRHIFKDDAPKWLLGNPKVDRYWIPCTLTLEGHTRGVTSVSFAHDDTYLASAGKDGTVRLWDMKTGACLLTMELDTSDIISISSAHRYNLLAVAAHREIKVLDPIAGSIVRTLSGHTGRVYSIAFSYDDELIASCSDDKTIRVWDRQTGENLHLLRGHSRLVQTVEFSPSDDYIASLASEGTIGLWDRRTGECLQVIHTDSLWLGTVRFSPSNGLVASGCKDGVELWNTTTGAYDRLKGAPGYFTCLDFSLEGCLLAAGSHYGTIRLWDWKSGKHIMMLSGHTNVITCVAFSHNGSLLASGSEDSTVKIWDPSVPPEEPEDEAFSEVVIASSHDGRWLAASIRQVFIQLWDGQNGNCIWTGKGHTKPISIFCFSQNNGVLASGSYDNSIRIWEVATGICLHVLRGHTSVAMNVVFSYDSLFAVSVSYKEAIIWDWESETPLFEHPTDRGVMAFSQDSRLLASLANEVGVIKLWQVRLGTPKMEIMEMTELRGHHYYIVSLTFSHNERLLASCSDDSIEIWDLEAGKRRYRLLGDRSHRSSVAWAPDDRWLVCASIDETIQFWDLSDGSPRRTIDMHTRLYQLQVDPSGSKIRTEIGSFHIDDPLTTDIQTIQRNQEGRMVTSGYGLSTDRVWITWNGQNVLWLPPEYRSRNSVVMGSTVAVGSKSGRLLLLRFSADGPSL